VDCIARIVLNGLFILGAIVGVLAFEGEADRTADAIATQPPVHLPDP